jgi:tRNA pseudouridine65 synthase
VVVDKPAGVVVHRGWADDDGGVLVRLRAQLGRRVWPVHRLDRGASGALAFALDAEAAAALGRAFAEGAGQAGEGGVGGAGQGDEGGEGGEGGGAVEKRYLALVRGHPPDELVIDHPIPAREGGPRVPAVTHVRRLGTWERYALVEARPRTGRLHQIRRHLKHISCPLIGDVNYGKGEHNRLFRARFGLDRLALHAAYLRLPHPGTGLPVVIEVAPSGVLAACLGAIGLAPRQPPALPG